MQKITDNELLDEVRRRFKQNKEALAELRSLTKQLEKVNKKLHESEEMKSNFLSNIRNEINNPLTSIMGLADNLISFENIDEKNIKSISNMIHGEAFALDFQLRNIFAAAEIEAGEVDLGLSVIDISVVINNLIDSYAHNCKRKNVSVKFIDKLDDDKITTDAEKMHLILANLIDNAIEYCYENTVIEIMCWRSADTLIISVKDYGVKISKSQLKVVFDRFKQVNMGTTKDHKGHGLGLCVCKALLELLNGEIEVSVNNDNESIITISIPELNPEFVVEDVSMDSNELLFEDEAVF